jgi:hypothetical protein
LGANDGKHELQARLVPHIFPLLYDSGVDLCLVPAEAQKGRLDRGGICQSPPRCLSTLHKFAVVLEYEF